MIARMTPYDLTAAALVLLFAYGGYRRGLIGFTLHLAGGVLAFVLAALLAPALVTPLARAAHLPIELARPLAVVGLTAALRYAFGFAIRELAGALSAIVRGIPPLAALDHLLGIVPGLALGVLFVLALTAVALALPVSGTVRDAAGQSWLATAVIGHPWEAWARVQRAWDAVSRAPEHIGMALPITGVAGLVVAGLAGWRLRALGAVPAPARPSPARRSAAPTSEGLVFVRAVLGTATALALMAGLVLLALARSHGRP